ncbi:hypothetical protein [Halanaeroarchaeum sulfurireducens]|nr:hypothetical protein [Halanaeroarchaeum sulfurireducens]
MVNFHTTPTLDRANAAPDRSVSPAVPEDHDGLTTVDGSPEETF